MKSPSEDHEPLRIDCADCTMLHTAACADCIVTYLCDRDTSVPIVVDLEEARAMRLLGDAGLAPRLRHVRRIG